MKGKFLSILLALVLLCSFGLVTAVPAVAADPGGVEFTTEGNGTAEWSTDTSTSGIYSVLLTATYPDSASVGVPVISTTLAEITQLSFWYNHEVCNPATGHVLGPDMVLILSDGGTFYIAGRGGALPSIGAWIEANPITGSNFAGTSTWFYGSFDGVDIATYTHGGLANTFAVLQTALSGTTVLYAGVNLDPPGEGSSGSVYVDVITVNNIPYDLEWTHVSPIQVDDDRAQYPDAPFQTIQGAIDCAIAGDTITVAAGTYEEQVVIGKSLTLNGAKASVDARTRNTSTGESILDGTGLTPVVGVGAFNIEDGVSGVIIDGFEVCNYESINPGGGSAVLAYSYGAATQGLSQVTIQNNYMHDLGWNGICVWSNNQVVQEDFTIQYNLIEEAPYAGIELTNVIDSRVLNNKIIAPTVLAPDPGDAGVGIEIAVRAQPGFEITAGTNVLVEGNEISGDFAEGSRAAINILSRTYALTSNATLTGVTVRGNTVSANVIVGILAVAESRLDGPATISNLHIRDGNTISGFSKSGIVVKDVLSVQIEGNTISATDHSAATNGIQIGYLDGVPASTGTTGTIKDNQVSDCHWEGYDPLTETYEDDWTASGILVIDTASQLTISGNEVQSCDVGLDIEAGLGTLITNNDVHDNSYGFVLWNAKPTISFNDIYLNALCGVYRTPAGSPGIIDATTNWFGDISGSEQATTNPGGLGNKVSDNVEYAPWLTRDFQTVLDANIAYFGLPMVDLAAGWNTFSTPVALDPACDTWGEYKALGDRLNVMGDVVNAYWYDAGASQPHFVPLAGDYVLEPCDAIYVRMAEPDIAAILFSPETSAPTKEVYPGWNLIGLAWLPTAPGEGMPVEDALTSLYKVPGDFTGYSMVVSPPFYQEPWTFVRDGDSKLMYPTWGYWVFMENGPDTLAGSTFTPMSLTGGAPPPPPPSPSVGLTEVNFQWYPVTEGSADYCERYDDDSFTYSLPWTFPFAGKDIVEIEVSSQGLIDLLEIDPLTEQAETSDVTDSYDLMIVTAGDYPESDIIFAWHDDLSSEFYGFYGVEYDAASDVFVVHWETETFKDENGGLEGAQLNYFQVWLFPDGSIKWNFKEFNYVAYSYGLGTGIYDSTSMDLLNVAVAMGEPDGFFHTPEKSYEISGEYMP